MVIQIISEQSGMPLSKIQPASRLREDLRFDSLDLLELTLALEEYSNRSFLDEDIEKWVTVQDVVNYLGETC